MTNYSSDKYIIGVDIGGTKVSIVLYSLKSKQISKKKVLKTQTRNKTKHTIFEIIQTINEFSSEQCLGIGVCIPGPLSDEKGLISAPPNLEGWDGINIVNILQESFDIPIEVNNDANASVMAEKIFGDGKDLDNILYVTVSTGVGSGIYISPNLLLGSNKMAGEIGHLMLDINGPQCGCGKIGCLEAMASGTAIANIAKNIIKNNTSYKKYEKEIAFNYFNSLNCNNKISLNNNSSILKHSNDSVDKITAKTIYQAAINNDSIANYIFWRAGFYLGLGLSYYIHINNPSLITLGGSVMKTDSLILTPIIDTINKFSWSTLIEKCEIKRSILGDNIADLGAIALVLNRLESI